MSRRSTSLVFLFLAAILAACSDGGQEGGSPSQRLSSVELIRTDAELQTGCRSAANVLGFAVPCPTRLPRASAPVRCDVPAAFTEADVKPKEGCALGEGFLLEPLSFDNPALSHLVIEASRGGFQVDCDKRGPHRRVSVRGHKALLIECPDTAGLHASHILLGWVEEGTFVIVSLHGHTELNRQVVQKIGAGIELIGPEDVELLPADDPADSAPAAVDSRTGWHRLADSPLTARSGHSAVWTGEEMIVLGGSPIPRDSVIGGAAYNPTNDRWRMIADAPLSDRERHTAVWTGKEMIVWGGDREGGVVALDNGAAYDPATDTWRELAESPLEGRFGHTAVWTGREMIVFGGFARSEFGDAAAYDPKTDRWRTLPVWKPRWLHTAVWTGREMIVWGGGGGGEFDALGGAYDPAHNRWRDLPRSPLEGRAGHAAVWTESVMLIVGGSSNLSLGSVGAAYSPRRDAWWMLPTPPVGFPSGHAAVWTGHELILWGGRTRGAAYDLERNEWRRLPRPGLAGRIEHTAVWTGREMIVWGGEAGNDCCYQGDGGAYVPRAAIDLLSR